MPRRLEILATVALLFDELQVHRLRPAAAAIVLGLEGELGAFGKLLQAGALDRRDVDEHVLAAALRRDEAEAAIVVEELERAVLARPALARLGVALEATAAAAAAAEAAAATAAATITATAATAVTVAAAAIATATAAAIAATATAIAAATATATAR